MGVHVRDTARTLALLIVSLRIWTTDIACFFRMLLLEFLYPGGVASLLEETGCRLL